MKSEGEMQVVTSVAGDVKTLVELRRYEGTIYAENNTCKPTTVNEPEREVRFQLGPKGRTDSIAILPPRAFDVPGFLRLVQRGDVTLSTDIDVMETKLAVLAGDQTLMDEHKKTELMGMVDESNSSRDLIQVECLVSKEKIYQRVEDFKSGLPPLADRYKHLASQFISSKTDDGKFAFTRIQT